MGSNEGIAKVKGLLSLVPLPLLKCPDCGACGKEDFQYIYLVTSTCPLEWDGPSKIVLPLWDEEANAGHTEPKVECVRCFHRFPLPEGWREASKANEMPREEPKADISNAKDRIRQRVTEAADKYDAAVRHVSHAKKDITKGKD